MDTKILNIQDIISAFKTLLFSWGSDTPPEAIWAANDMMAAILDIEIADLKYYLKEEDNSELDYINFLNQLKITR